MGKTIEQRRYRLLSDFLPVHEFLTRIYALETLNSYLLPPFFEYAHTHPFFRHQKAHHFGIWEEEGRIVGIACFEMSPGDAFLVTDRDHGFLLPEMLAWSERELSDFLEGKRVLSVWVTDKEPGKIDLLAANGYSRIYTEPVRIFSYDKPFPAVELPEGYSVISLEEENDIRKIHECLWKGFDHGDQPDDDLDCRVLMQSGPHFRKDLTTVVKAPDGEYACFAGMWLDERNRYAYLEPLATVPAHRRKGLATVALAESMRRTKALGAKYCFGGAPAFYPAIGFETLCLRELWRKAW